MGWYSLGLVQVMLFRVGVEGGCEKEPGFAVASEWELKGYGQPSTVSGPSRNLLVLKSARMLLEGSRSAAECFGRGGGDIESCRQSGWREGLAERGN